MRGGREPSYSDLDVGRVGAAYGEQVENVVERAVEERLHNTPTLIHCSRSPAGPLYGRSVCIVGSTRRRAMVRPVAGARLRLAVIGAGRMGQVHLRALAEAPSIDVRAVVEPVAELRAGRCGRAHDQDSARRLLAEGGVDAALIAASTDRHVELIDELARAGVHVLCREAVQPIRRRRGGRARAELAGITLQIGYWRRFVPELVKFRGIGSRPVASGSSR